MQKKTIGNFIAVLRKSNGMTQQELADRLNVSNKTISKWECDAGYPELTLIPVIAEIFNVTSDEILQGRRISKEEPSEKIAPKIDQQINRLIRNTVSKYRMAICIAGALSFAGIILLFIIAYGIFRPYIALGILMLFILASFVLAIFQLLSAKTALNTTDMLDEGDRRLIKCDIVINKAFFYLMMLNLFLTLIGIPIGIMGDAYSVVTFEYFASNVLPHIVIFMIPLFLFSYVIYQIKEQKRFKIQIEHNPFIKSKLRKLNIFSIVSLSVLGIGFIVIPLAVYSNNKTYVEDGMISTTFLPQATWPFFLLFSIICVAYLVLKKKIIESL